MDREWLERELAAGRSIEVIAREAGKHPSTVAYWVNKHGLSSGHAARHAPRGAMSRERLQELVEEELSVRQIAERTGRSATTVRYWLKQYELATRPRPREFAPRPTEVCPRHGLSEHVRSGGRLACARCRADGVTEWRRRAKRILVQEAGGCCVLCDYDRCIAALTFHHTDPAQKRFGLGARGLAQSLEKLREEARKCVLVCANCHAEVEAGMAQLPFASRRPTSPG